MHGMVVFWALSVFREFSGRVELSIADVAERRKDQRWNRSSQGLFEVLL